MAKVLCIDDTAAIRALLRTILTKVGIEVVTATSGAEGMELIANERPDAILLDLYLPDTDGLEMLRRIAENPALTGIPIMILSGNREAKKVKQALALGAADFVVKPFDHQVLRQRVRRLLELKERPVAISGEEEPPKRAAPPPELQLARRVLVVDDQPANLAIAQDLLSEHYEVLTARSGAGALALATKDPPDLILMDLYMPIMDGVEALRRLRQFPELAAIKVLAMSLQGLFITCHK